MGGVDRTDGAISRNDFTRKQYFWFVNYGLHIFQRLVMNAHFLSSKHGGRKPLLDFITAYAEHLLTSSGMGRKQLTPGRSLRNPLHIHRIQLFAPIADVLHSVVNVPNSDAEGKGLGQFELTVQEYQESAHSANLLESIFNAYLIFK